MNVMTVLIVGLAGAFFAVFLKQYRPEYALIITALTTVVVAFSAIGWAVPVISEIKGMIDNANVSYSSLSVIIKSIGICYLTQITSDVCKDAGQVSISSKIELIGRIALCISAIPLYRDILSIIETIIGKVT